MDCKQLATACALALALGPATAAAESTQAQVERQGIANASAAGMEIDPRAEPLMARAPLGTCANDPTYRSSRYRCTATPIRLWRAEADGYALRNGVWWAGSTFRQNELTCG